MVFYEQYIMLSRKMTKDDMKKLFLETSRMVQAHNGYVFRIRDLGWRKAAYRVNKPRVGRFHYGRYFYLAYGAHPEATFQLGNMYRTTPQILRWNTFRMEPKTMMQL
eukprot:GDKI01014829.1.p1 GENE.GDKI01014829.1~~GDKI01014829.1.p1  ORF type:complete len:107 (-),score=11.73 GDKI01014829.1:165-485(-)